MSSKELIMLQEFFDKEIDAKDFAKYMRRLNHALISYHIDDEQQQFKDWISDGYFWLNHLIEKLDPVIEDKVA